MPTTCPICERRPAKRGCPGLSRSRWAGKPETICAPCCGVEREVSIDCPADCLYLIAAHRYEAERRTRPNQLAFPNVVISQDDVEEKQHLIASLSLVLVRFAREHAEVCDPDVLAALDALAQSYQTLDSGLYYEQDRKSVV